jgi:hypothetical protein
VYHHYYDDTPEDTEIPVSEREESVIVSNEDTPEDTEIPVSEREESVIVSNEDTPEDTDMPVVEAEHAVNVSDEDTSDKYLPFQIQVSLCLQVYLHYKQ